jgi:hypothetical protein
MATNYLRRFGGLILSILLLPAFVILLAGTTAQAQRRVIIVQRPVGLTPR